MILYNFLLCICIWCFFFAIRSNGPFLTNFQTFNTSRPKRRVLTSLKNDTAKTSRPITFKFLMKVSNWCQETYAKKWWHCAPPFLDILDRDRSLSHVNDRLICWKHDLAEKIFLRVPFLWCSVTWRDPINVFNTKMCSKSVQVMPNKLCNIPALSFHQFSGHVRKAHGDASPLYRWGAIHFS